MMIEVALCVASIDGSGERESERETEREKQRERGRERHTVTERGRKRDGEGD